MEPTGGLEPLADIASSNPLGVVRVLVASGLKTDDPDSGQAVLSPVSFALTNLPGSLSNLSLHPLEQK